MRAVWDHERTNFEKNVGENIATDPCLLPTSRYLGDCGKEKRKHLQH